MDSKIRFPSPTGWAGTAVVAIWSFYWTYTVGHRGLFAFDQSLMFDGGWRIYSGQVPYKDFLLAFGPLSFAIQALFFKLCGVNWTAMVVSAATMDVIAALSVMRTMALLVGGKNRSLIFFSGLLMGTAFQPIFGTLWMDQVAFLFFLLGLQMLVEARRRPPLGQCLGYAAVGACAVLSFLSKQNIGTLTAISLGILILVAGPFRPWAMLKSVGAYLLGCLLAAGLFWLWLVEYSDVHLFVHHALQVPSEVGRTRIWGSLSYYPQKIFPWSMLAADALAFIAVILGVVQIFTSREVRQRVWADANLRLLIALTCAVPLIQAVFQASAYQDNENVLFLSGLALCVSIGLLGQLSFPHKQRLVLAVTCGTIGALLFVDALYFSWFRTVQNAFPGGAKAARYLQVPPLARLQWITPTYTHYADAVSPADLPDRMVTPEDVENVYTYLLAQKQPFFLIGDSSYLYGITGTVPANPLLYYQTHHFYADKDVPALDEWLLTNLQKSNVSLIVREKQLFFADAFPFTQTKKWVADNFRPGPNFGEFEILVRTTTH